jgi:integrase/recombinase XerD
MNNHELIRSFLSCLHVERGSAENTISNYERDVWQFAEWFDKPLTKAKRSDIQKYIGELLASGMSGRSAARKVSTLRTFYKILFMDRVVSADPMSAIQSPEPEKVLPRFLAPSEVDAILNPSATTAEDDLGKYLVRRDQAILELLYASGLRVSEIAGARLEDLNLIDRCIVVRGKGDKERIAPFGQQAATALRTWLALRRLLTKDSPWLFVGRWGRQLTRQRLWKIVSEHSARIGRKVSPHMFRHSCATHMIENGADLRTVQTILGHALISTTQIYTNVSPGWVWKEYLKHHPRAGERQGRQMSLPIADGRAAPQIGPTICAHCMEPVCSESKWYCARHLLLQRERSRASWKRIRERRKAERKKAAGSTQPSRKRKAA